LQAPRINRETALANKMRDLIDIICESLKVN
jgi:hypothetical protein